MVAELPNRHVQSCLDMQLVSANFSIDKESRT
jgi:hypothetical protein